MAKILLYSGNALILWFEYSRCSFSSFLKVHQKLKLWLKILNTKGHFWVSNKVALIIKNSKDHKNRVKSCCRPLHHIFLQNLHKKSGLPYLTRGQQNFLKIKFLSIFSIFRVCWWRNLTWEFNVRCYENCVCIWSKCGTDRWDMGGKKWESFARTLLWSTRFG